MADIVNDVLGTRATIDSSDVKRGADEYVSQIERMRKVTLDTATVADRLESKYKSSNKTLESLTRVLQEAKNAQRYYQDSIAKTEARINSLNQRISTSSNAEETQKLNIEVEQLEKLWSKQAAEMDYVREITKGIQGDIASINQTSTQTETKTESIRTKIRNLREELIAMKEVNKDDTKEYEEKRKELSKLLNAQLRVNKEQGVFASPGSEMQALREGITGVTGALTAGTGVMGLFNEKLEQAEEIQTKLQSVMSISMGVQQLLSLTYSTSTFRIVALNAAKKVYIATTSNLYKAMRMLGVSMNVANVASKALFGTLSLGLAVAIPVVINFIDKYRAKQEESRKAVEAHNEAIRKNREEENERAKAVGKSIGDIVGKYKVLKSQYEALNSDKQKSNWIIENQSAFNSLEITVNNLNDAYRVFISQSSDVVKSLTAIARAKAFEEIYTNALEQEIELENTIGNNRKNYNYYNPVSSQNPITSEEVRKLNLQQGGISGGYDTARNRRLVNEYRRKNADNELREQLNDAQRRTAMAERRMQDAFQLAEEGKNNLTLIGGKANSNQSNKTGNTNTPTDSERILASLNATKERLSSELALETEYSQKWIDIKTQLIEVEKQISLQQLEDEYQKNKAIVADKVKLEQDYNSTVVAINQKAQDDINNINIKSLEQQRKREQELLNSRQEFFIKYGTPEEAKQALGDKYYIQMQEALSKGNVFKAMDISKQWSDAVKEIDFNEFKKSINWEEVFGDLDKVSTERLQVIKKQLQDVIKEGNFNPEQIKALVEALDKIEKHTQKGGLFSSFISNFQTKGGGFNAVMGVVDAINSNIQSLPKMLDAFGMDKNSEFYQSVSNFSNGINEAVGAVKSFASGDVIGAIAGVTNALGSLGDSFFGTADWAEYNRMVEQYGRLTKVWDDLIAKKKEYISESWGVDADKAAKDIERLIGKEVEAQRELGKQYMNSGSSWRSSSMGTRQRDRVTSTMYNDIIALGSRYASAIEGRMTGLFDLTAEELQNLKENVPQFWAVLDESTQKYLDNIINSEKELEDVTNAVNERITGVSWSTFESNFKSALRNIQSDVSDFTTDFEDGLRDAIINSIMKDYSPQLKKLYAQFVKRAEDGTLTQAEADALKEQMRVISEQAIETRDRMLEEAGLNTTSTQEATRKSIANISQDSADAIEGRITSIDYAVYSQLGSMEKISADTSLMRENVIMIGAYLQEQNNYVSESVDILRESNGYLFGIEKNTRELYEINERLGRIEENTRNI